MSTGGYFGLELPHKDEYHKDAIRLNTGRNAFEYILTAKKYKKVYLPYYTCDVMLEPIIKHKLSYEFYHIDKTFRPEFNFCNLKYNEVFVYNNYFGICETQVKEVANKCANLIIDNSQAFYSKPLNGVDTFYSPRKFFGIPDGAYLYTDTTLNTKFEQDISYNRCSHLLGRIDTNAESHYNSFKKNSSDLSGQPIKTMSNLTTRLLQGIDYMDIAQRRIDNFNLLHHTLGKLNELDVSLKGETPLVYPLLLTNGHYLRQKLITNNVFVATYWTNVLKWTNESYLDYKLALNLIPIPIDQRYNHESLLAVNKIIENIIL